MQQKEFLSILSLLSELSVYEQIDFDTFLKKLIKLIGKVVKADSCLIYIFDRDENNLKLVGSKKRKEKLLGRINLDKGEGITGWVYKNRKMVILPQKAYDDKRFKSFPELPEDKYEAFLSLPIINIDGVLGVINIQNKEKYKFSKLEINTVQAIVHIIATAFERVSLKRKIYNLEEKLSERKVIERAKGVVMRQYKLSEDKAYKMIRDEAMKKRIKIKQMAEALLLVLS